jgi:hypothetical protein
MSGERDCPERSEGRVGGDLGCTPAALCPCFPKIIEDRDHSWPGSTGGLRFFSHGVSAHFDAMGVVNQAIEDAVSDGGISDLLVPARDRHVRDWNSLKFTALSPFSTTTGISLRTRIVSLKMIFTNYLLEPCQLPSFH